MFRMSGTGRKGSKTTIYRHHFLFQCYLYFRLTISTADKIHDNMKIVDDNGDAQDLPPATVQTMIGAGWAAFISAWIINIAFYKVSNL